MVKAPSTKKSHLQQSQNSLFFESTRHFDYLQPEKPSVPSRLPRIPDAKRAPKALLIEAPQARSAVRKPSSFCLYLEKLQDMLFGIAVQLYHRERRNTAPGKNAASTNPIKKRKIRAA
jgi:hypothetical protein